jgi:SAM-dependent methyltransferase
VTDRATEDGSPVDAYALLPAEPELGVVRQLLGERRTVLDLGCGTGRIADPLAAEGRHVVAVDESVAMLQRMQRATPVQGRIEELALGRTFDGVLLLSHLINGPHPRPLLAAAARHLAPSGVVIIQRLEPGRRWREGSSKAGPVLLTLSNLTVDLPRVAARTTYRTPAGVWNQDWVLYERDDNEITRLLTGVGLALVSAAGAWLVAALES